jgi:hypothetical protein
MRIYKSQLCTRAFQTRIFAELPSGSVFGVRRYGLEPCLKKPGSEVDCGKRRFATMQVISFETVVVRDVETGEFERLPIAGLRSISGAGAVGATARP